MSSIANHNAFAALAEYGEHADSPANVDEQAAPQLPANDVGEEAVYVPETQLAAAAPAEPATTREELEPASPAASAPDDAPKSPRPVIGQVHELELTPSSGQARAERSEELGNSNKTRWGVARERSTRGSAKARNNTRALAAQVSMNRTPTDYTVTSANPEAEIPQFSSGLALHQERFVTGNVLFNAASTSLPSRPLGAPRTRIGIQKAPVLPGLQAFLDGQAASTSREFIKSEPLAEYVRREPVYRSAPRFAGRNESPTRVPASSHIEEFSGRPQPPPSAHASGSAGSSQIDEPTARPPRQFTPRQSGTAASPPADDLSSRPPYPFAQPPPRFTRSPTPGPFAHAPQQPPNDMDRMSVSDEGDPADDMYDQPPHVARAPRASGIAVHNVSMTEKIIATARRIAAELAYSTVPVNACGDATPVDGLAKDAHLISVPREYIDHHLTKVGDNLILELWSINGRRAHMFSTDDQLAYMHHILDRMFLESFPDHCIELSLLFTPPDQSQRNAPRARPCLFMASKMHPRQKQILRSARFWTAAGANFMTYGVSENKSKFTTAVGGLRCATLDDVTAFIKKTLCTAPALKDMLAKKLDNEDDPSVIDDVASHIAETRIAVTQRKVRPAGQSADVTQYSIYADVYGIIDDEDLPAFDLAMRRVVFSHPDFGISSYHVWECTICHAVSHEAVACDAHVHLRWPLLLDQQPGRNNHRDQPANAGGSRRGGFQPGRR
ncbi:hypothetical protein AURDEDRAFT_123011 [Auricularia subglabra TFB-10046 SS5]|nr:hypothetical protein AURDEDRAFT_123011 [Auricularia subglabra TFB-10046 SS5]